VITTKTQKRGDRKQETGGRRKRGANIFLSSCNGGNPELQQKVLTIDKFSRAKTALKLDLKGIDTLDKTGFDLVPRVVENGLHAPVVAQNLGGEA